MIRSNKLVIPSSKIKKDEVQIDDKRCLFKDQSDTLPWGHYKVNIERKKFIQLLKNLHKKGVIEK